MTERYVSRLESMLDFFPDTPAIYIEWRRLVSARSVSGRQVHDARLVAAMNLHGVSNVLTFNVSDFRRYSEVTAVHPRQVEKI